MRFVKMNGLGNDFIIINNMDEHIPVQQFPSLARRLCHRQFSIGADGLMVIEAPQMGGDFRMRFLNSDGSYSEMCGNGARCLCRYGHDFGLSGQVQRIETDAGMVCGQRVDQRTYRVELNKPANVRLNEVITPEGRPLICSYVELGNPGIPHAAVEWKLSETSLAQLRPIGSALRHYEGFPKGANVNFFELLGVDHIAVSTFERGVEDFTLACGTGVGSTVALLTLQGRVSGRNVTVKAPGGTLVVDAELEKDEITHLYLTAPTTMVCAGEIFDEETSSWTNSRN